MGWNAPTGEDYLLTVTNAGGGMAAEQLSIANRRLAGLERFTVAPR